MPENRMYDGGALGDDGFSDEQIDRMISGVLNRKRVLFHRNGRPMGESAELSLHRKIGANFVAYNARGEMFVLITNVAVMEACREALGLSDRTSPLGGVFQDVVSGLVTEGRCGSKRHRQGEVGEGMPCEVHKLSVLRARAAKLAVVASIYQDADVAEFSNWISALADSRQAKADPDDEPVYGFDALLSYYRRGLRVVMETPAGAIAGVVVNAKSEKRNQQLFHRIEALCLSSLCGGIRPLVKTIEIAPYPGRRPVSGLPCRAICDGEFEQIRAQRERMLDVVSLHKPAYVRYQGVRYEVGAAGRWVTHRLEDRVVLDPAVAPMSEGNDGARILEALGLRPADGREIAVAALDTPALGVDEEASIAAAHANPWLLMPLSHAYCLSQRRWAIVDVGCVSPIEHNRELFEAVALEQGVRRIMLALCTHRGAFRDVIENKGGGAIFLLSGPSGSGKTFTAEALAEYLSAPLYRVSLAEMGTSANAIEAGLERAMRLCQRWGALLLIDEADVLMERRREDSLERNAVVASLLKAMDYYAGILFLTTNRAERLDEAIASRISLSVRYQKPAEAQRAVIWQSMLSKIGETEMNVSKLARHDLSARGIRNCLVMALSLAGAEAERLSENHVAFVVSRVNIDGESRT